MDSNRDNPSGVFHLIGVLDVPSYFFFYFLDHFKLEKIKKWPFWVIFPLLTKTRKITPLPTPRPPRSLQAHPFVFAVALGLLFVARADLKHRCVQRSGVRVHHVSDAQAVHLGARPVFCPVQVGDGAR